LKTISLASFATGDRVLTRYQLTGLLFSEFNVEMTRFIVVRHQADLWCPVAERLEGLLLSHQRDRPGSHAPTALLSFDVVLVLGSTGLEYELLVVIAFFYL
jgi:hypothetical protein